MAGRPNVLTGALPSTYGVGAWGAQGSSKNYRRPMTYMHTGTWTHGQTEKNTQPHSNTATQPQSHTASQPHRHTDTQTHRHTNTHTHSCVVCATLQSLLHTNHPTHIHTDTRHTDTQPQSQKSTQTVRDSPGCVAVCLCVRVYVCLFVCVHPRTDTQPHIHTPHTTHNKAH